MWEQIRSNQIRSVILVAALGGVFVLVGWAIGVFFFGSATAGLILALVIWFIMNLVAYYAGDSILLGISRAKKITHDDHPRLFNVVEEMKIASGLAYMPSIYIIDTPAMNAFATGRNPKNASVAITSGLLQRLNRDELQGVIAHEIAHIKNRDVLLMAMCSVLLGTIVILAWYASRILFYGAVFGGRGSRRSGGGGGGGAAQIVIFIVALLLMILAPILAYLIYYAISRRREYLADASAALYTRYPEGLASALEKLSRSTHKLETANNATAPMYIINPLKRSERAAADLSATHPPISDRIRILRSMAGGASFAQYNQAYSTVHGGKSVIGAASLTGAAPVAIRRAGEAATTEPEPTMKERARETSEIFWNRSKHKLITCQCGTRLRIPPNYKHSNVRCPHCGTINTVPRN